MTGIMDVSVNMVSSHKNSGREPFATADSSVTLTLPKLQLRNLRRIFHLLILNDGAPSKSS